MVKKKGSREMNPMDAFRKSQRSKEIAKNKKGRQFQREAHAQMSDPSALRQQLKEILDAEEAYGTNPALRMKRKALQEAYNKAIHMQMEKGSGRSEDGCTAGPSLDVQDEERLQESEKALRPHTKTQSQYLNIPLPPIPPPIPPPYYTHGNTRPRPPYLPHHSIRPGGAPPSRRLPLPPSVPSESLPTAQPVIVAQSTVVPLTKAHHDSRVTSLVPSTLLARRSHPTGPAKKILGTDNESSRGFGLVPRSLATVRPRNDQLENNSKESDVDGERKERKDGGKKEEIHNDSYESFLESMRELGAV